MERIQLTPNLLSHSTLPEPGTPAGLLRSALDAEISTGLRRLDLADLDALEAEAAFYPAIDDAAHAYDFLTPAQIARVRAVGLLAYLAQDSDRSRLPELDEAIRQLRKVAPHAAATPPEALAYKLRCAAPTRLLRMRGRAVPAKHAL